MGAVSVDQRAPIGALPVGAKLERYEILAKLAAGGMAIVYVARAHGVAGFERLFAVKVLHSNLAHEEEFIKMFLDEARLAARIRHPNVVPTIDINDSEKTGYFIVMEYIEGDHLGQLLASATKAGEKLPIPVTLRIIGDALGGLGAAHNLRDEHGKSQNLVHRDVSPHNIMVGRDGVTRLTDFGVAKAEDRLTHTRDGQVKGKLAYMAPEQAASGTTDIRSDLFSMGVILWECLTGQRLLRGESTAATLHKLLHGEIPKPSSVDPALAALDPVLQKALARDASQRFQTAEEFARALEDVAGCFGGAASLREVGKICRHYAATKLKRDKKLIEDAIRLLRPTAGGGEYEGMVAIDETSSPTSPSSSDVSILARPSRKLISKVGVLANDTMPGTRRARRTPELTLPKPAMTEVDRAAAETKPTLPPLAERPSTDLVIDIQSSASLSFEAKHDTLELADPTLASRRRARLAVVLLAAAGLVGLTAWVGSTPSETVRVEQMEASASREPSRSGVLAPPAAATARAAQPAPATAAATVVPVTTVPAEQRERAPVGAPVNAEPPAEQVIAPVVPSTAPRVAPGPRTRETVRNARSSVRRQRETSGANRTSINAARQSEVIPNPYHD